MAERSAPNMVPSPPMLIKASARVATSSAGTGTMQDETRCWSSSRTISVLW